MKIFSDNYDYITNENEKNHAYQLGTNKFSHLTNDEFKAYVNKGGTTNNRPRDYDPYISTSEFDKGNYIYTIIIYIKSNLFVFDIYPLYYQIPSGKLLCRPL